MNNAYHRALKAVAGVYEKRSNALRLAVIKFRRTLVHTVRQPTVEDIVDTYHKRKTAGIKTDNIANASERTSQANPESLSPPMILAT